MVFHWRLNNSKCPQASRTLLSILAVFNNAVVWMVSTQPPTSKSSRPFNNPLVTVPKAPITIGIIVNFMFYSFFNSLARSRYLSFFSLSFFFLVKIVSILHLIVITSCPFYRSLETVPIAKATIQTTVNLRICLPFGFLLFFHSMVRRNGKFFFNLPLQLTQSLAFCLGLGIFLLSLLFYYFEKFSYQCLLMVSHESASDSKFPHVFRTLLSIQANLNNAVVWMISIRPLISKSTSPCTNPFGDCTDCTDYNWYHRHFHVIFMFF